MIEIYGSLKPIVKFSPPVSVSSWTEGSNGHRLPEIAGPIVVKFPIVPFCRTVLESWAQNSAQLFERKRKKFVTICAI